ncbi:MAG TPA: hypothetical protein VF495_24880, partial [Phenylobacterium sp.]
MTGATASATKGGALPLRTIVVDGPLALKMRRLEAADANELGVQILTLPQLAARLAGGFLRAASTEDLERATRSALQAGEILELAPLRDLPGMARATVRSLERLWRAGYALDGAREPARLADLAQIADRVRESLPGDVLALPDLVAKAVTRASLAPRVLGEVRLEAIHHTPPIWRPLLEAIAARAPLTWVGTPAPAGWPGA